MTSEAALTKLMVALGRASGEAGAAGRIHAARDLTVVASWGVWQARRQLSQIQWSALWKPTGAHRNDLDDLH